MSVSSILKQSIEEYANRLARQNELLQQAREGTLHHETVARYLTGLRYLIAASPDHLRRAIATARESGNERVAAFLEQKLAEEEGHHEWADADLVRLREQGQLQPKAPPTARSMVELVAYLSELVARDPEAYMAYIFLAEYFTVLIGPEWLSALEGKCSVPRAAMTVVGNHVELDVGHVEEGSAEADSLIAASSIVRLETTVRTAMRYYDAFFDDLARHNRQCRSRSEGVQTSETHPA